MRKSAGFEIEERIVTYVVPAKAGTSPPSLPDALTAQEAYIRQETLSDALHAATPPPGAYTEEHDIDGATLTVGVVRTERS